MDTLTELTQTGSSTVCWNKHQKKCLFYDPLGQILRDIQDPLSIETDKLNLLKLGAHVNQGGENL